MLTRFLKNQVLEYNYIQFIHTYITFTLHNYLSTCDIVIYMLHANYLVVILVVIHMYYIPTYKPPYNFVFMTSKQT